MDKKEKEERIKKLEETIKDIKKEEMLEK